MSGPQIAKHVGKWLAAPVLIAAFGFWMLAGLFDDEPFLPLHTPRTAGLATETANSGEKAIPGEDVAPADERRTSEAELDKALFAAFRETAAAPVSTRAVLSRYGVLIAVTAELPEASQTFGRYVNLRFTVIPREGGFEVRRLAIGRYEVPSGWIDRAFRFAMRRLEGAGGALAILSEIRAIDPVERSVTLGPRLDRQGALLPAG